MEVEKIPIDGVLLIKPIVHGDERGYFLETWQEKRYKEAGISLPFVQDNRSKSTYGILRGSIIKRNILRVNLFLYHSEVCLILQLIFVRNHQHLESGLE